MIFVFVSNGIESSTQTPADTDKVAPEIFEMLMSENKPPAFPQKFKPRVINPSIFAPFTTGADSKPIDSPIPYLQEDENPCKS